MVSKPENLEKEWNDELESLVEELMQERNANEPNPLVSEEQKRNMIREELKEMLKFEIEAKVVTQAIHLIAELGPNLFGANRTEEILGEIQEAGERMVSTASEVANSPEKTPQLIGMTQETLNDILKVAFDQYEQEKWENAETIYHFLVILTPASPEVWMCLGSTQQNQGKIRQARENYVQAAELDTVDPHYPLYIAECFLLEGDLKSSETWEESGRERLEQGESDLEVIEMFDAVKEAIAAAA